MTRLTVAGITCVGKVREHNEDCLGLGEWIRQRPMARPVRLATDVWEPFVCLVADGMGGHAYGEAASRMVAMRLQVQASELADEADVLRAIKDANDAVHALMAANPEFRGMGTTLAGVVVCPTKLIGFNVGDSRIYRVHHGYLQLLSTDDVVDLSYASTAERTGVASHAITQSIGGTLDVKDVDPHVWTRDFDGSERFIICTDGLTDMLDQDEMEKCLSVDIEASVRDLYASAIDRGGCDNISIVAIDVEFADCDV